MDVKGSIVQSFLLSPGLQGGSPFRLCRSRLCGYKAYARYTPGQCPVFPLPGLPYCVFRDGCDRCDGYSGTPPLFVTPVTLVTLRLVSA